MGGGGVFYNYDPIKLPDGYVWAKDGDFEWKTGDLWWSGAWYYVGKADKVAIPHTINGEKVTSYRGMFYETSVSGVYSDNSKVTDMSSMFNHSTATSLDLTYLDTSGVTDMSCMFGWSEATTLDLSKFNTSKVTDMSSMFNRSLAKTLDLSSFDTSNVKYMLSMFVYSQATTLDLSSFNTSKVTNINNMFEGSEAKILDLSSFDISNAANMYYMFYGSKATKGYARTQNDADRFNDASQTGIPSTLKFIVKPKTN